MSEHYHGLYIFGEAPSGEFTLACATPAGGTEVPFKICLDALHQSLTYEGVLEGRPTQYVNQRIIERKVKNARKLFGAFRPHVIPPREKVVELNDEDSEESDRTMFVLPAVCCVGSFNSEYSTNQEACDYSALKIVWFQDDWALPVQDDIVIALRSLPWMNLAQNCWY